MGMFDYVYIECPKCGYENEFQSKGGPCNLDMYHGIEGLPKSVLEDLDGDWKTCPKCGTLFGVKTTVTAEIVTDRAVRKGTDS
jgi:phage FluMu protein Com